MNKKITSSSNVEPTQTIVCGTPVPKPTTAVSHYRSAAATLAVGGVIITRTYLTQRGKTHSEPQIPAPQIDAPQEPAQPKNDVFNMD